MRLGPAVCSVLAATLVASWSAGAAGNRDRTYRASCGDSVYQSPPQTPPPTDEALRLGPVVFNHLAPADDVYRANRPHPYYQVPSFFNVLTSAPRGVTITVGDRTGRLALIYGNVASKPLGFLTRLGNGRATLADGTRTVSFPLCHDPTSKGPLITQYGFSILLDAPGCFTIRVQPIGRRRRYAGTVRVLVPRC